MSQVSFFNIFAPLNANLLKKILCSFIFYFMIAVIHISISKNIIYYVFRLVLRVTQSFFHNLKKTFFIFLLKEKSNWVIFDLQNYKNNWNYDLLRNCLSIIAQRFAWNIISWFTILDASSNFLRWHQLVWKNICVVHVMKYTFDILYV